MDSERKIPRITHQIWFQGWDKLPAKFQVNADALARLNPNYTHMKWDEQSLRAECLKVGPEVAAKFDSFPLMIQKIDFGRYVVLYNHGGISVDTDMAQLKPIDTAPHIDTADFIVSKSSFPAIFTYNNALIMVSPQHHILLQLLSRIITNKEIFTINKEDTVNKTTGPAIFNNVIASRDSEIIKLDNKYFEPCNSFNKLCRVDTASIMDHQHEASWQSPFIQFLSNLLFIIYCVLLVIISLGILYGGYRLFHYKPFYSKIMKLFR